MLSWISPEFHYHEKDEAWPIFVVLAIVCVAGFALWQHNFLFFVFTLIAGGLMLVWGRRRPRHFEFSLTERGISIDGAVRPYRELESFAVSEDMLQLHPKSKLRPHISVIIPENRRAEIREYLLAYLPEIEYTESFIEALGHLLRF